MIKNFIILLVIVGCAFGEGPWDELVDQAIDAAKEDIIGKHFDVVDLPNIDQEFHEELFGIPIDAVIKVIGGEFWNTSSVGRKGPVTVLQDGNNITFSMSLGLDDMNVKINSYYFKAYSIQLAGEIFANCKSNALEFSLSLIQYENNTCVAHINFARITSLSGISVELKPKGFGNWILEHILSLGLNTLSSKVRGMVNVGLTEQLNYVLRNVDICGYIPV